jgi:hypothetical protein
MAPTKIVSRWKKPLTKLFAAVALAGALYYSNHRVDDGRADIITPTFQSTIRGSGLFTKVRYNRFFAGDGIVREETITIEHPLFMKVFEDRVHQYTHDAIDSDGSMVPDTAKFFPAHGLDSRFRAYFPLVFFDSYDSTGSFLERLLVGDAGAIFQSERERFMRKYGEETKTQFLRKESTVRSEVLFDGKLYFATAISYSLVSFEDVSGSQNPIVLVHYDLETLSGSKWGDFWDGYGFSPDFVDGTIDVVATSGYSMVRGLGYDPVLEEFIGELSGAVTHVLEKNNVGVDLRSLENDN